MKHKIQKVELFVGVIILLGGLLTYGLGVHQLLPVAYTLHMGIMEYLNGR